MKKSFVVLLAATIAGAFVWQCATYTSAQAQGVSRRSAPSFETRFWNWLQDVEYRNWAPVPGKSGDPYPGKSPHGASLKMYLNRTAAGHFKELPPGSILVKENYGKDEKTLMAVTVMYRSTRKYDPEHNDWYWVKYLPDGTVARTPPEKGSKPIAGKFPSCISCHSGADGDDFVFLNDGT